MNETDLLVRFGMQTFFCRMLARALVALLLLQPVYVAFGMELEGEQVEDVPSGEIQEVHSAEEHVETVEDAQTLPEDASQESPATEVGSEGDENVLEEVGALASDDPSAGGAGDSEQGSAPDTGDGPIDGGETKNSDGAEQATTTEESVPGSGETTEGEGATSTEEENENHSATSSDELADAESGSEKDSATSTSEATTTEAVVPMVVNNENKYSFAEGECTLVAESQFYCVAGGAERQIEGDPRVYAQQDREGDREIYFFDGVEVRRITNNGYDDFAPVFDEETQRIVWQAMINDRLQIMLYELPTNTTRQITKARENSSNPHILGDVVVWQQWVATNWEVMMTDVGVAGGEFEIEQLTDNAVHDMFPQLYDDLITWQSERGSSWEVVVYDRTTGKRHTLEKNEGTKYENPRFVLLFDSKHENGDVETIGYDLKTGEQMELGTRAAPKPAQPKSPREEVPEATISVAGSSTTTKLEEEGGGT